jgi:hypothetical protein
MAEIEQEISILPTAPQLGQDQNTFDTNTSNFLPAINNWRTEINTLSTQINIVRNEINVFQINAKGSQDAAATHATNALSYKNDALLYRNDALAAKQSIDGYVIPTNATYTPEQIDTKIQNTRLESFLGFTF